MSTQIMGHEGAGVVTEIGEGVTVCRPGDRVLLNWAIPWLRRPMCLRCHLNLCRVNNTVTADPPLGHAGPHTVMLDGEPILLDLYASGRLLLDELVTARYALEDLGEAFDDMHQGRVAKGVIVFD